MEIPPEEHERRIQALKSALKSGEVALVFSPINIFYFTNTFVKGVLVIKADASPELFVSRPLERAKKESRVEAKRLRSLKELPELLRGAKRILVEENYFRGRNILNFLKLFDGKEVLPLDGILWNLRAIKSEVEVRFIKRAAQSLARALKNGVSKLKVGLKEVEAASLLERELRLNGHPGYTRSFNGFELAYGYFVSGKEGLLPTHFVTGEGGKGIYGFPGGATTKKLKVNEPILVDFSGFYGGYYCDQTRMLRFKDMDSKILKRADEFLKAALEVLRFLENAVVPGRITGEVYEEVIEFVKGMGFDEYFMKHGEDVGFVGHGVGLEIDEPPYIAKKQKEVLKEGMVLAFEPKFHVPGLGVIGLEDTYLVTAKGLKRLTSFPRRWLVV